MSWIGFDFDGTLVGPPSPLYNKNYGPDHPEIVNFMRLLIEQGAEVRIFTARGCDEARKRVVKEWLRERGLPELEITDKKDFDMVASFDDLCVPVHSQNGNIMTSEEATNHLLRHSGITIKNRTAKTSSEES